MNDDGDQDSIQRWRKLSVAPALIAVGIIGSAMIQSYRQGSPPAAAHSAGQGGEVVGASGVTTARTAVSMPGDDPDEGYYADGWGMCYFVIGETPRELVSRVEARTGLRVSGYGSFDGGLIVRFRNGGRVAVWRKEIDCKDPPYNPLAEGSSGLAE